MLNTGKSGLTRDQQKKLTNRLNVERRQVFVVISRSLYVEL